MLSEYLGSTTRFSVALGLALLVAGVTLAALGREDESQLACVVALVVATLAAVASSAANVQRAYSIAALAAVCIFVLVDKKTRGRYEHAMPLLAAAALALAIATPTPVVPSRVLHAAGLAATAALLILVLSHAVRHAATASASPPAPHYLTPLAAAATVAAVAIGMNVPAFTDSASSARWPGIAVCAGVIAVCIATYAHARLVVAGRATTTAFAWIGFAAALVAAGVAVFAWPGARKATAALITLTVLMAAAQGAASTSVAPGLGIGLSIVLGLLGLGAAAGFGVFGLAQRKTPFPHAALMLALLVPAFAAMLSPSPARAAGELSRAASMQERVSATAPGVAALGLACATGSLSMWLAAGVACVSPFVSDAAGTLRYARRRRRGDGGGGGGGAGAEPGAEPPSPPASSIARILDACDDECRGKGVLCLAACRNKCQRSYCIAAPAGREFPKDDEEALFSMCVQHAAAHAAAARLPPHVRSPRQQHCVAMHEFDACVDTLCKSALSGAPSSEGMTRADAEDMASELQAIDDSITHETDDEFMARLTQTRILS